MIQQPNCLITGCRLVVPGEGKHVWGDLHELGGCYIFNAVLDTNGSNRCGEAAWNYDPCLDADSSEKQLIAQAYCFPFERRGVLVFPKTSVIFNKAASDYIRFGSVG